MANRRFGQFFYTTHAKPVLLDVKIPIGATGAVGTIVGPGVASVTRVSAGIYAVRLQDNYAKCFSIRASMQSPVTGAAVNDGSFVTGTVYEIVTVGSTDWAAAGLLKGVTAAVGVSFVAAGAGGAGTGTAKALGVSGIAVVEAMGNPNLALAPIGVGNMGGQVIVQCLAATSSSVTTLVPTDPASGSTLALEIYLSDSSISN